MRTKHPRFTITPLPLLPGGDHSSVHGINDAGQAVGLSSNGKTVLSGLLRDTRAVLWEKGGVHDLVGNKYASPDAFCINDRGQVLIRPQYVGSDRPASIPPPELYTLLWDNGVKRNWRLAQNFEAQNLDNRGHIVGRTPIGKAALWTGGRMWLLPMPAQTISSQALAINDAEMVVGTFIRPTDQGNSQLFLFAEGRTQWIRPHSGHTDFNPAVVTGAGMVMGIFREAKSRVAHLFVFKGNDYQNVATLGRNGAVGDANRRGAVVGTTDRGAFLYQDGQLLDLVACIAPRSGWKLFAATGINDQGFIVGNGMWRDQYRAFLLAPQI